MCHQHKLMFSVLCRFRGKIILGYTETELCSKGSGYQFIHAADMMYCADNHIRSTLELHTRCLRWSLRWKHRSANINAAKLQFKEENRISVMV